EVVVVECSGAVELSILMTNDGVSVARVQKGVSGGQSEAPEPILGAIENLLEARPVQDRDDHPHLPCFGSPLYWRGEGDLIEEFPRRMTRFAPVELVNAREL